MSSSVDSVLTQALDLNPKQRALVVKSLLSSIDPPPEESNEQAWMILAKNRLDELEKGDVEPVSWGEMKRRVRAGSRAST